MTNETTPRRGRHVFTVNAGREMLEFEQAADDFEVDGTGVHFFIEGEQADTVAFVSHPCIVRKGEPDGK